MQTIKVVFLTLVLCCVLLVVGVVAGFFAGMGIGNLRASMRSTSWSLMDSPVKFAQIIDANTDTLWAESLDGKLYEWNCQASEGCSWTETKAVPADAHEISGQPVISDTCQFKKSSEQKKQPKNIVQCAIAHQVVFESSQTDYYALLGDGTIWHGFHSVDGYDVIYIRMISTPIGGILGIIAGTIIMYRREKKAQHQVETNI